MLAGAGVLIALSTLRPAQDVIVEPVSSHSGLRSGEVAVPVALSSPAIAGTLAAGDILDVLEVSGADGNTVRASVVAPSTRVLEVPDSSGGFGTTSSAVVLLAVREADALDLSAAAANGPVSVLIRTRSSAG